MHRGTHRDARWHNAGCVENNSSTSLVIFRHMQLSSSFSTKFSIQFLTHHRAQAYRMIFVFVVRRFLELLLFSILLCTYLYIFYWNHLCIYTNTAIVNVNVLVQKCKTFLDVLKVSELNIKVNFLENFSLKFVRKEIWYLMTMAKTHPDYYPTIFLLPKFFPPFLLYRSRSLSLVPNKKSFSSRLKLNIG